MKQGKIGLLLCILLFLLAACQEEQNPIQAVRSFMAAIEALDHATATDLVCEQQRPRVKESLESFGNVTQLSEAFDIRFENLDYQERSNDGEIAVVRVKGTLTLTFLGQQDVQLVDEEHLVVRTGGKWLICDP